MSQPPSPSNISALSGPSSPSPSKSRVSSKTKKLGFGLLLLVLGSGFYYLIGDNIYTQASEPKILDKTVPYVVWYSWHYNWSTNSSLHMSYGENMSVEDHSITLIGKYNYKTFRNEIKVNWTNGEPNLSVLSIILLFNMTEDFTIKLVAYGQNGTYEINTDMKKGNAGQIAVEIKKWFETMPQIFEHTYVNDSISHLSMEFFSQKDLNVKITKIWIRHEERDPYTFVGPGDNYPDPFIGG